MSLTGMPLLVLVGLLTLAAPVAFALVRRRVHPTGRSWRSVLGRLGSAVGCQVLAVSLTFLVVNNSFAFYSDWGDLLGTSTPRTQLKSQSLVGPGEGRIEVVQVHGKASGAAAPVLVWLPPQYDQPAYAKAKFPVTMVLPGQPSTPAVMFSHFGFAANAVRAIDEHLAKPFIAVFPPLMTNPPRDTECTDIPRGPQAETWLSTDVRAAVLHQTRATSDARRWSVMGWSTGAFCAVKLMLRFPSEFGAAAGFGGYYEPITDHTTGNLFHGSKIRRDENSPLWLYRRGGMPVGHRMLLISGQQDSESWPATEKFLTATQGDPAVSSLTFDSGGHNYRNYRNSMPKVLEWLGAGGSFG